MKIPKFTKLKFDSEADLRARQARAEAVDEAQWRAEFPHLAKQHGVIESFGRGGRVEPGDVERIARCYPPRRGKGRGKNRDALARSPTGGGRFVDGGEDDWSDHQNATLSGYLLHGDSEEDQEAPITTAPQIEHPRDLMYDHGDDPEEEYFIYDDGDDGAEGAVNFMYDELREMAVNYYCELPDAREDAMLTYLDGELRKREIHRYARSTLQRYMRGTKEEADRLRALCVDGPEESVALTPRTKEEVLAELDARLQEINRRQAREDAWAAALERPSDLTRDHTDAAEEAYAEDPEEE